MCPDSERNIFIDGDGSGHYAYLPAMVLFNSVDFTPVFEVEKDRRTTDYMGHYFHKHGEIYINKYTMGTAIMQLPFFVAACVLSALFGFPVDGYNIIFQYASAFSSLFWVTIGLTFLIKLLRLYNISALKGWLMAMILLFGSNLFFYVFVQPSFSHVYSFALIAIFLYLSRLMFVKTELRYILMASFILGMIVIVRPVNIIVAGALPFMAGNRLRFLETVKYKTLKARWLYVIMVFVLAVSPQMVVNYMQTGSLLVYGYDNEGFNFMNPHFMDFLFSYRKGWFVYTPLFLLLLPAVVFFVRKRRYYELTMFVLFFAFVVFLFSSWWNWFYGDSFGMRPMVDYYALFFLFIAIAITNIKKGWGIVAASVFVVFAVFLNQVQTYQYAVGIIHADSMTKEAYWYVFLKTDRSYSGVVSETEEYYNGVLDDVPFFNTYNSIDSYPPQWKIPHNADSAICNSGSVSVRLTPESVYCPSFRMAIPDTLAGYDNIYVKFSAEYLEKTNNAALGAVFVVDIGDNDGSNVFYKSFKIKSLPDDKTNIWKTGRTGFKLPPITPQMDYIKMYIWNVDKTTFWVDDMKIEMFLWK